MRDTRAMIVSLRPGHWFPIAASVPQRRRVIILGATEAGVSAAFHLGETALLLERRGGRGVTSFERHALCEVVTRWDPPELTGTPCDLPDLTSAETRLGVSVNSINVYERRLGLSTGESFVYDKLISALQPRDLQSLLKDPVPARIRSDEALRYWLNGRDIELIDSATQRFHGDVDGQAAGQRVAECIRRVMMAKYTGKPLFQPRLVPRRSA
jgi:hypothetical protein